MKAQLPRHKPLSSQKNLRSISIIPKKDSSPLTTADLTISALHFFSEKIESKSTFSNELWPRRRIVLLPLYS